MKLFSLFILAASSASAVAQPQESAIGPRFPPVTATLDAPIEWKAVRGVDGKPLKPQMAGGFKVELVAGAWAREQQFYWNNLQHHSPQSNFDEMGFAGFAIQPRITDRDGKILDLDFDSISSGLINLKNGGAAGGSWEGGKEGGLYFSGLTPYAQTGTVDLNFADPQRPPEAEGRFETKFQWPDLPYPMQVNTFLPVGKTFTTAHGSQLTLTGYGRYESGLLGSSSDPQKTKAGIYFFIKQTPPEALKDAELDIGGFKVGARDADIHRTGKDDLNFLTGVGGDLHEGNGSSPYFPWTDLTAIFAAPNTPRPLHLQLEFREYHPSWKQNKYFHSVSFPFDFRGYPMPTRDAKFAPIVTAKNADVEVALDLWQDRSDDEGKKRYLAWFWTRDLKIKDDPSLRWIVSGGATRPEWYLGNEIKTSKLSDGGTTYRAAPVGFSQWTWRFRPDGAPVLGSEYRPALNFSADALQGQPQEWDMSVEFAQWRIKKHEWNWKEVPVPPMGQKIAVNHVAVSPTGLKIKLLNVASYDAAHQFAGIEGGFGVALENKAQGVAFTFETELAQFPKPKAFDNKELQANVVPSPGSSWDLSSGGDHDQISGQKSTPQILRWTKIYPLAKLEANSFDFQLSWEADYPTGRTASFDFRNLPAPVKDSR